MNHLNPYQPIQEKILIEGDIQFLAEKLVVKFQWSDPEGKIAMGDEIELERLHELWKHTCFEAFIHAEHQESYYEINLSATGGWNAYEFQKYRTPQPPQQTEQLILLSFHREENLIEAQFELKNHQHVWWCSLTAVVELTDGKKLYFAVEHKGDRPDFHLKESFKLRRVNV